MLFNFFASSAPEINSMRILEDNCIKLVYICYIKHTNEQSISIHICLVWNKRLSSGLLYRIKKAQDSC